METVKENMRSWMKKMSLCKYDELNIEECNALKIMLDLRIEEIEKQ